jgi:exonuclease SbcD
MRKPLALFVTDIHLRHDNTEIVEDLFKQVIQTAKNHSINEIIIGGDFFDSRTSQRLVTLKSAKKIFSMLKDFNVHLIAGNHDKSMYTSESSFVDIFEDSVKLYKKPTVVQFYSKTVTFIPFFENDILVEMIQDAEPTDILVSHFEVEGAIYHPDGDLTRVVPVDILKKFKAVYLGHIHDYSVTEDFVHQLPSIRQNNFGENTNKGFTIIYDDLSIEILKSKFKEYKTFKIDLNETSDNEVKDLLKEATTDDNSYKRIIVTGNTDKLKSFDRSKFESAGVKVNIKQKQLDYKISLDSSDIFTTFKKFCEENELDFKTGTKYLNYLQ